MYSGTLCAFHQLGSLSLSLSRSILVKALSTLSPIKITIQRTPTYKHNAGQIADPHTTLLRLHIYINSQIMVLRVSHHHCPTFRIVLLDNNLGIRTIDVLHKKSPILLIFNDVLFSVLHRWFVQVR